MLSMHNSGACSRSENVLRIPISMIETVEEPNVEELEMDSG